MQIRSRMVVAVIAILALVIVSIVIYVAYTKRPIFIDQPTSKVLRFTYTLTNTSPDFIASADLLSYLPLNLRGTQNIVKIDSFHDYEIVNEDDLHQSVKFSIQDLPPYGSRIVSLTLHLDTSSMPIRERIKKAIFLKDEKYIEVSSNPVNDLIATFDKNEPAQQSIYNWLVNNLQDAGYVAENKGAKFALEQRMGDCTEHMYAFIALARASGIPARGVAGFVVENPAQILTSSDYHNWAEFYDGEKWVLVDSQRRVFDDKYQHYIPFRLFGSEASSSLASTNRFLTTDSRISISL